MPIYKGASEIASGNFYKGSANIENGYKENNSFYVNSFTLDFLVVGGGGGANYNFYGGGGGAGGYRASTGSSTSGGGAALENAITIFPGTAYNITVGVGGNGGSSSGFPTSGADTIFSNITSIGGGRGGGNNNTTEPGGTGGSGGGGGGEYGGSVGGGSGTTGQGYGGGGHIDDAAGNAGGGGGGGAGSSGTAGSNAGGGTGGSGIQNNITGTLVYYSVGPGGGRGYPPAGGDGADGAGWSYVANTGNGANRSAGGAGQYGSGDGLSGVIILKYPATANDPVFTSGVTATTTTSGNFKITRITAASSDTITF